MTTFCQFSSLTLSIYIYKNNKVQRFFQQQFLENRLSDLVQIWELSLVCLSLCNRPILISNTTTSCCLYNHLNNDQRRHVTIYHVYWDLLLFCFKIFFALFQRYTRLWLFLIPLQRCHFSEFYKISAFFRPKFHWFLDFFYSNFCSVIFSLNTMFYTLVQDVWVMMSTSCISVWIYDTQFKLYTYHVCNLGFVWKLKLNILQKYCYTFQIIEKDTDKYMLIQWKKL